MQGLGLIKAYAPLPPIRRDTVFATRIPMINTSIVKSFRHSTRLPCRHSSLSFNVVKMVSKSDESHRAGADIYRGDADCRKKSVELLSELGLPKNLFPMVDIEEFGYNRKTGYMWLHQKKSTTHTFAKIDRQVSYATAVTAFVGPRSIEKLSGVKTKELFVWLTVAEMYFADADTDELTFRTPSGISDSCDASVFDM